MTTLEKEKLTQEIDQLKNQNYWAWTTIGPILVGFAGLFAALYSFITWIRNRQDEQKKREEEQKRWLDDRQAEREKRAEERFQSVVEGLGSISTATQVGAAIMLRTFLRPSYEQFYSQAFDLAVAHLSLRQTSPSSPEEDPDNPLPETTLSRVLIMVFKEAFPLARDRLKEQDPKTQFHPQSLDATGIQLDLAYLENADLDGVWMPQASLRKTELFGAMLKGAELWGVEAKEAKFSGADLSGAKLKEAKLKEAKLWGAKLKGAELWGAELSGADFREADLSGANVTNEQLAKARSLKSATMPDGSKHP